MSWAASVKKILRFVRTYGIGRTWFKVIGRNRSAAWLRSLTFRRSKKDIGVIGCGQFAFSTLGYVINKNFGNRFEICYDSDRSKSASFSRFFGVPRVADAAADVIDTDVTRVVYIVSNHASHSDYAIQSLGRGRITYIEKPISVTYEQFARLCKQVRQSSSRVYAGYNRPFSKAISQLRKVAKDQTGPITLSCFIVGHHIERNHWYRNPSEGTRICGNVGHWLDLAVHLLSWERVPIRWVISIAFSSSIDRDDDLAISLTSEGGDLIVIVLTSRAEPFEGINETIVLQKRNVIAKIDDFRAMTIWKGDLVERFRYRPKDVGHEGALLQPFNEEQRDWREVELSTLLMLFIKEMVVTGRTQSEFSFSEEWTKIDEQIAQIG